MTGHKYARSDMTQTNAARGLLYGSLRSPLLNMNSMKLKEAALYHLVAALCSAAFAVVFKSQQLRADLRAASGAAFISLFKPGMISSQVLT